MGNEVLYNATRGISDLILMPGLINLDFADVRTTMTDGGAAIMGASTAEGPDRAEIAAREAINSPLLDGVSIRGARNVLVNISAGSNLGMRETTTATSIIQQEAGEEAEIILGTVLDESFGEGIRVTVIATGFDLAEDRSKIKMAPNSPSANSAEQKTAVPSPEPKKEIATRFTRHTGDFYKGESNLRSLDKPSFQRRDISVRKEEPKNETRESDYDNEQSTNIAPFQSRTERIRKDDSDQPAFLRKIMD